MKKMKIVIVVISFAVTMMLSSCSSIQKGEDIKAGNEAFLSGKGGGKELFRVLFSAKKYAVKQMRYTKYIKRSPDAGGDQYMSSELKKLNKIDEVRESVVRVWLFPDSGNLMKIRPISLTFLTDIDRIISEDIQRWSFKFPKRVVEPTKFDIRYRVVLRKTQTDAEILKEIQDKMAESN